MIKRRGLIENPCYWEAENWLYVQIIIDKNLRRIKKSAWYERCSILSVNHSPKISKIIGWMKDQIYAQKLQTSLSALTENSEILWL